ncbi:MAG TPA: CoA-binding protein [Thauera sp.]|nr:CoA-binding protein [Burkholderiaceae bacterium]HQZ01196.1 CoA-binding protein [Thauera sp.]HRA81348.1 CoA-binding protein [Thauera sp.]
MHANDISADRSATRALLEDTRSIAIVGLSPNPARASNEVARYLRAAGYTIIPINPACDEVLGEKCYASLREVPGPIDMVDVFRRPEEVMIVAADAIAVGARSLWLQLGVIAPEAAERAAAAGLKVVMDRCTKVEHAVLIGR